MLEAYKNFWLGYLDFYGRTKRSDYWWVVLINGVIGTLIFLLMDFLGETKAAGFTLTAFILFIAATALPTISMQIRRLRDANFNVAWIVLKATPLLVVLQNNFNIKRVKLVNLVTLFFSYKIKLPKRLKRVKLIVA